MRESERSHCTHKRFSDRIVKVDHLLRTNIGSDLAAVRPMNECPAALTYPTIKPSIFLCANDNCSSSFIVNGLAVRPYRAHGVTTASSNRSRSFMSTCLSVSACLNMIILPKHNEAGARGWPSLCASSRLVSCIPSTCASLLPGLLR